MTARKELWPMSYALEIDMRSKAVAKALYRGSGIVVVHGVTMRVIGVHGSTITVRPLRWHERAWRWLKARVTR